MFWCFPPSCSKGGWYYSASVFALWTLSSPELTLHQISGLGCYEASAEIFALGRAPFSLNRLRGLLMHFYFFMCRTIFQWRQAGMKGQKQRMITCKKKRKIAGQFLNRDTNRAYSDPQETCCYLPKIQPPRRNPTTVPNHSLGNLLFSSDNTLPLTYRYLKNTVFVFKKWASSADK